MAGMLLLFCAAALTLLSPTAHAFSPALAVSKNLGWLGSTWPTAPSELLRRITPRTGVAHMTGIISPANSGVRPARINGWERSWGRNMAMRSVDPGSAGLGDVGEADSEMDEIEKEIEKLMAKKAALKAAAALAAEQTVAAAQNGESVAQVPLRL